MAAETLGDKLWKFASSAAYELGIGPEQPNGSTSKKKKPHKKGKSPWPSCVSSHSDSCQWGGYAEPDATEFDVRGRNYLSDRVKRKSKPSLFKLANVELYSCELSESYHIATHHKSWYRKHNTKLPKDTFFLIYNMQLASLNTAVVATFVMKTNQPPNSKNSNIAMLTDSKLVKDMLADLSSDDDDDDDEPPPKHVNDDSGEEKKEKQEKPPSAKAKNKGKKITFTVEDIESIPNIEQKVQHNDIRSAVDEANLWCPALGCRAYDSGLWRRCLRGDELFINERLKIIPRLVEGGWYFAFPQRPALLGMKTPQRCYRGPNYLEIDCEADNSLIAAQITKAAYHISTYLVVDIMLTLEGHRKQELPERCLGGFQLRYPDTTKAIKLNVEETIENEEEYYQQSMEHNHNTL